MVKMKKETLMIIMKLFLSMFIASSLILITGFGNYIIFIIGAVGLIGFSIMFLYLEYQN